MFLRNNFGSPARFLLRHRKAHFYIQSKVLLPFWSLTEKELESSLRNVNTAGRRRFGRCAHGMACLTDRQLENRSCHFTKIPKLWPKDIFPEKQHKECLIVKIIASYIEGVFKSLAYNRNFFQRCQSI